MTKANLADLLDQAQQVTLQCRALAVTAQSYEREAKRKAGNTTLQLEVLQLRLDELNSKLEYISTAVELTDAIV